MLMMELGFRILLTSAVLLLIVSSEKPPRARRRRCNPDSHKYYVPSLEKCRRCPPCDPGWGLPQHPQEVLRLDPISGQPLECYSCMKCPTGKYSQKADRRICQPCLNCTTLARRERTACSPTNNTVCGECQSMYYDVYMQDLRYKTPDLTKSCKPCSPTKDATIPECTLSKSPDATTSPSTTIVASEKNVAVPYRKQSDGETVTHSSDNPVLLAVVVILFAVLSIVSVIGAVAIFRKHKDTNLPPMTVSYHQAYAEGREANSRQEDRELHVDGDSSPEQPSARLLPKIPPNPSRYNDPIDGSTTQVDLRQKMLLRHVGRAWPDLARVWGLTDADVEYLRAERWESEGERIHQMILTWERKLPMRAKVGQACQGLEQIGCPQLAQELLKSTIYRAH